MRKQLKNFEDLISIIPNAFDDKICDNLISYHTWAESNKLTTAGEISSLHKPDPNDKRKEIHEPKKSIDCRYEVHGDLNNVHFLNEKLINSFMEYCGSFNTKEYKLTDSVFAFPRLNYDCFQIQKYLKGEGHFIGWHLDVREYDFPYRIREYVYTLYLNDVEEGGETEFLHLDLKVKPKKGTLMWFPVHYPYVHRGNVPLSGDKYIMTGWVCKGKVEDVLSQYQMEKINESKKA